MKKNILIISIYYPPKQSIASNRIYSFAKYLNKEKYNIFVHTIDENIKYSNDLDDVVISRVQNNPFFKTLPFNKKTNKVLHYAKVIYNQILLRLQKNIYQKWIDESFLVLKDTIKKKKIDLIISSFAPDASHILALKLKQEFPHLKWIADMRDEMSQNKFFEKNMQVNLFEVEKQIAPYTDAITSTSKPFLDTFAHMLETKHIIFKEIRNGFDFDITKNISKNSVFTISFVGSFYGALNPENFLNAMSSLYETGRIKVFKIIFIGVKTHFKIPENIRHYVIIIPPVSHENAIKEMRKSDVLLLLHPKNGRKGVFTGKLFEYLGTLKPIIALVDTEDVAAKLILQCKAGYVADFDNIEESKESILLAYLQWKEKQVYDPNIGIIKKHHRKEQVKRLEKLIEVVSL